MISKKIKKKEYIPNLRSKQSTLSPPTQLQKADFDRFDYIFAMDESNLSDIRNLQRSKKGSKAQVMLWGRYAGGDRRGGRDEVVEDPYYGGTEGFDVAYEQCARFTANFLKETFPDVKAE